jgi:chromatin remodeling complex protein RSC6
MATTKQPAAKKAAAKKPAAKTAAPKAAKATAAKTAAMSSAAKKPAAKAEAKQTATAGFMKPMTPSAALAAVIGSKPIPRTEVTKKLWDYIKAKNLQDPDNKRQINADAALKEVFGKPSVSMFEMTKLVGNHLS